MDTRPDTRPFREQAKEKLGVEVWEKVHASVDSGQIDRTKMKEIVLQLVPKAYGRHNARMEGPTKMADSEEMAKIIEDWWNEPAPAGLHSLDRVAAVEKLVNILRSSDVHLPPLAQDLEEIMQNLKNTRSQEEVNRCKSLPVRRQARSRLGDDVWKMVMDNVSSANISQQRMKAIANQLGDGVSGGHKRRMEQEQSGRAEMTRIFEDWWEVGSLSSLSSEDAVKKLVEVFGDSEISLFPLAKELMEGSSIGTPDICHFVEKLT